MLSPDFAAPLSLDLLLQQQRSTSLKAVQLRAEADSIDGGSWRQVDSEKIQWHGELEETVWLDAGGQQRHQQEH